MSEWQQWGSCSAKCDGGVRTRDRVCVNGEPDGKGCEGDIEQTEACNTQECVSWSEWSDWSDCSVTCAGGSQSRSRMCSNSTECEGEAEETKDCNFQVCPHMSEWQQWGSCSAKCDGGVRTRDRVCVNGEPDGEGCEGDIEQTEACNTQFCSSWSPWSPYEVCSASCNGGITSRVRMCRNGDVEGSGCPGNDTETIACNTKECASWSEWSDWSDCSVTCAGGSQSRSRTCSNGMECDGEAEETKDCNFQPCPAWTQWSNWTMCSVTCSGGNQSRSRVCENENNVTGCVGESSEKKECNIQPCPTWMEWSDWSTCSMTCEGGSQSRVRICENESENCEGDSEQTQDCNSQNCPRWSEWNAWSDCDVTCGGGTQTHNRRCIDGNINDVGCVGPITERQNCSQQNCPFWSEWSEFGECSVTCGNGFFSRRRSCRNGNPGDIGCLGVDAESAPCDAGVCPQWGVWGAWSECSESCGGGIRTHDRRCLNGTEGEIGCEGPVMEDQVCNTQLCPTWSSWGLWSHCDVTCGGGAYRRNRTCYNVPINSTATCAGDGEMTGECNTKLCPRWSEWSRWSNCDVTCGGGTQNHNRRCVDGNINDVGCVGPIIEWQNCSQQLCASWTEWAEWSPCTTSCGGGITNRTRECLNGVVGQPGCIEEFAQTILCNSQACSSFGDWGAWGACSVTCDGGTQTRSRDCVDGEVGDPGCDDVTIEGQNCNFQACPRCDPNYHEVGLPNGEVNCTHGSNNLSACQFACNKDHFIVGNSALVCGDVGGRLAWSDKPPICLERCSDKVDVVFVIDSSSSIGTSNFEVIRGFLTQLVRRFRVGSDAALFGALRYNREIDHLWNLEKYSTKTEVLEAIDTIPYDGSGTLIGKAINYTREFMFDPSVGARDGVPKIAVVVTDGVSFDDITVPSLLLKDDNVLVVSIGIGRVDESQVLEIASGTGSEFATTVTGFDTLGTIVNSVADQIMLCQGRDNITECPDEPVMDILFIVDSSSSVGSANFELMRDFILNMIGSFMIGTDYTQIGFIKFNRDVTEIFQLDEFSNIDDVMTAVKRVEYSGSGTNTGQALEFAAANSLRASAGRRPGVPAVSIVITDGKSQTKVYEPSQQLQRYGQVIAVGIQNANLNEIQQIASRDEFVFNIDSFVALDNFIDVINLAVCKAGYSPLSLPRNK